MADTDDAEQGKPHVFELPSIDSLLKGSALAGAALYAGLAISYQRFYGPLGITPEDLGVTQVFILGRTVALLPKFAFSILMLVSLWFLLAIWRKKLELPDKYAKAFAPGVLLLTMISILVNNWVNHFGTIPLVTICIVIASIILPVLFYPFGTTRELSMLLLVAMPFLGLVLTESYITFNQAASAADAALSGRPVHPVRAATLPLSELEIRADTATVTWVGPSSQRPKDIFPDENAMTVHVLYLGQNTTTVYTLLQQPRSRRTLLLPLISVVVAVQQD